MSVKKYQIELTREQREELLGLLRGGRASARKLTRARILLKANEGFIDKEIARVLDVSMATVWRIRKRFAEEGLASALCERTRPGQRPKLSPKQKAHLIAVACSHAPQGHSHWTLRLLADKAVQLGFTDSISHEAVRAILKKTA